MRELIRFLLVGVVEAWIASILVRGRIVRLRGCFPFLVFGIAGALGAGYLVGMLGQSSIVAVLAAGFGALVLLVFMQFLRNA